MPYRKVGLVILGLDVSTSCTGWCVLDDNGKMRSLGYIDLKSKKGMFEKAAKVKEDLLNLLLRYDIQEVAVEENLQAFRPGLSSAKTLMTLAQFNGIVKWLCHSELSVPVSSINVNSARKLVGLKLDRKSKIKTKEQVLGWVQMVLTDSSTWPTKILKSGPRKGKTIFKDQCYDMADAYIIGKAHFLLKN